MAETCLLSFTGQGTLHNLFSMGTERLWLQCAGCGVLLHADRQQVNIHHVTAATLCEPPAAVSVTLCCLTVQMWAQQSRLRAAVP